MSNPNAGIAGNPVLIGTATRLLPIGTIANPFDTPGAVATKGLPLAVPVGRNTHFSFPVSGSRATTESE